MTDPISDMLTRIRNAVSAKHARVDMPASKLKAEIARILQDEGYIQGYREIEEPTTKAGRTPRRLIRVALKYGPRGERVITGLERISRPGRRVYLGVTDVPLVLGGLGHQHPDHLARRHDGPGRQARGRGRRSTL